MIDSKLIYAKRMMDKSNKIASKILVREYYNECRKVCNHDYFIDRGYFRIHNSEYIITSKEKSEFRIIECCECHNAIMLLKSNNPDWDIIYFNKIIDIREESVNLCKKIILK